MTTLSNKPKITPTEDAFVAWQHYLIFICEKLGNANVKEGLEEQAELIGNNKLIEFDFIPNVSVTHTRQKEPTLWSYMPVVCFKDIKCKYRPHLYFGDYYLVLVDRGSEFQYYFMSKRINYDKSISWEYAQHPHISSGNPCLGNFQGDMNTSMDEGNVYQFLSVTKKYLEKYNGRSVFTRGTRYKPENFVYKMVHETEFWEEYGDSENIDYDAIMRDATRWGFPREMAGMGEFSLTGLDRCSYQRAKHGIMGMRGAPYSTNPIRQSNPTILKDIDCVTGADWYNANATDNGFYDGYVYWVHVMLECTILEAQWIVNRYFNSLYAKFKGVKTTKDEDILKGVYLEWHKFMRPSGPRAKRHSYPVTFGNTLEYPAHGTNSEQQNWLYQADTTTHRIKVPISLIKELQTFYEQLKVRFGGSGGDNSNTAFTRIIKAPNKMASKIVAITRNDKSLESLDYKKLMGQDIPKDITEECVHLADRVRAHILEEYHTNLSKEKGRVLNEWKEINPSRASGTKSDDWGEPGEQASLFSDTL